MKWAHPLKGRSVRQALADALSESHPVECVIRESDVLSNHPVDICYNGQCSWSCSGTNYYNSTEGVAWYHSWDPMRDCLKYGFEVNEDNGEVSSCK